MIKVTFGGIGIIVGLFGLAALLAAHGFRQAIEHFANGRV